MADPATALEQVFAPVAPPIAGALAAGPYNFQFTGEDNLRLTVVNSLTGVAVGVHYRSAPTPTTIQTNKQVIVPTSDRLASTTDFPVGRGYLLNVSVFATAGAPLIGQTFVKLQVIRGMGAAAIVLGTVVQGYVTAAQDRAWPGSPIEDSISGGGVARVVLGSTPAAGVEIAETVPPGARWELVSCFTSLTCSAAPSNRRPILYLSNAAGNFMAASPAPGAVGPSGSINYFFEQGMPINTSLASVFVVGGLPEKPILLAGHGIHTTTENFAAADQYLRPVLTVREWLEVN